MKKVLFSIWFLFIFGMMFGSNTQLMAEDSNVYPSVANKLKQIELGKAVFMFIPPLGTKHIGWTYQSNSDVISWIDDTYENLAEGVIPDGTLNRRTGIMRINVKGIESSILKKKKHELAWSVVYRSHAQNPNLGVETIQLEPGINNGKDECFGSTTENCTFNPLNSLASSNINVDVICKSTETTGLILTAKGKNPIKAKWVTSGGSGGSNSWIELFVNYDEENICKD